MPDWFQRVGWVERSETHQSLRGAMMGIASLYPSYGLTRRSLRPQIPSDPRKTPA